MKFESVVLEQESQRQPAAVEEEERGGGSGTLTWTFLDSGSR